MAGGIGITPVRALAETMDGDVDVIHRVLSEDDIVFARRDRRTRGPPRLGCTTSSATTARTGRDLLSPAHLRELVPDLPSVTCTSAARRRWSRRSRETSGGPACRAARSMSSGSRLYARCGKPRIYWTFAREGLNSAQG